MGIYRIEETSKDHYDLYENEKLIVCFTRGTIRESLEKYAYEVDRSSHWIGNIITLLHRKYPSEIKNKKKSKEQLLQDYGLTALIDYLKSKGFRVSHKMPVSDTDIVRFVESHGYQVEGLLEDVYYSTDGALCGRK